MSLVEVHVKDKVAELALNRCEKMNALSTDFILELVETLMKLRAGALRGEHSSLLIYSKSPKAFCAGADLKERMGMDERGVLATLDSLRELMDSLDSYPLPTMAVLEGVAFGGGLELALACDLRLASSAAKVGLTETQLAIIPGAGGTQRLPRIVGEAKAKELIFRALRLGASEAFSLGLFNYLGDDALERARSWAKEISLAGPLALRASKEAINEGRALPLNAALDIERNCYEKVLRSEDRLEALRAFSEKRPPLFRGR